VLGTGLFNSLVNVWADDSAIAFDGVNDSVTIDVPTNAESILQKNGMCLSLWVKAKTATINADLIIWMQTETEEAVGGALASQYLWYDVSEQKIKWTRTDTDGDNPVTSEVAHNKSRMFNAWTHIVVQVPADGGEMVITLNGNEVESTGNAERGAAWGTHLPDHEVYYGFDGRANNMFFNGYISNVAIWLGEPTDFQILDIYNAGEPKNELESYDDLFFYHVSNEKTFVSDTGYQIASHGGGSMNRVNYSGAIIVSKPSNE
jgi:hypothetical protein